MQPDIKIFERIKNREPNGNQVGSMQLILLLFGKLKVKTGAYGVMKKKSITELP